jgi:hypothetical protein
MSNYSAALAIIGDLRVESDVRAALANTVVSVSSVTPQLVATSSAGVPFGSAVSLNANQLIVSTAPTSSPTISVVQNPLAGQIINASPTLVDQVVASGNIVASISGRVLNVSENVPSVVSIATSNPALLDVSAVVVPTGLSVLLQPNPVTVSTSVTESSQLAVSTSPTGQIIAFTPQYMRLALTAPISSPAPALGLAIPWTTTVASNGSNISIVSSGLLSLANGYTYRVQSGATKLSVPAPVNGEYAFSIALAGTPVGSACSFQFQNAFTSISANGGPAQAWINLNSISSGTSIISVNCINYLAGALFNQEPNGSTELAYLEIYQIN